MSETLTLKAWSELSAGQPGDASSPLAARGFNALQTLRFPTTRDEDWRFNDLRKLAELPVSAPSADQRGNAEPGNADIDESFLTRYRLPECSGSTLVMVDGRLDLSLSDFTAQAGVEFHHLNDAEATDPALSGFDTLAPVEEDFFTAVHATQARDVIGLVFGAGVKMADPIHLLHIQSAGASGISAPRLFLNVQDGAELTLIEEHISADADTPRVNIPVIEAFVASNARLNHLRIQRENKASYHFSRPVTKLAADSEYHSYTIALGARLFRNEPRVIQDGENVNFTVDGLVLIDGDQVSDTHSLMDHRHPHGNSHQLHKVVVNGNAHSVFNGKIFVRKDAQIIDSFQENRNLLLSDDGKVNTKPQLEIFADDVRCSHGATIGQLDPEEVFYLQSRGMTEEKAKEVLTYAFALETIENIEVESVHKFLIEEVKAYTSRNIGRRAERVAG